MASPFFSSAVTSSASLTGNTQVDSLLYGTYWSANSSNNGMPITSLTYSFITINSTFAINYSNAGEDDATYVLTSAQQNSINSALSAWSSVANLQFTRISESFNNVGDLRFGGYEDMDSSTAAWAYLPGNSPTAGDVWIGPTTDNPAPVKGTFDYLTFMHEIGHALGLKHSFTQSPSNSTVLASQFDDVRYTIMSYTDPYLYEPTTPMLLDIAAMQSLYGANNLWQTGNNTYSWATGQSVFETIWDAGGNDTIDASNQAAAVRINLNEGAFSKIGQAFLNVNTMTAFDEGLAIAYGAKIENATGSAHDDTLIGNALGNVLNGMAGADTLDGGAGGDSYYVDNVGDVLIEQDASLTQIDSVMSSISYTLGANFENLKLLGGDNLNATGNALNNRITGNTGANTLDGGSGSDTLTGGAGNDTYLIDDLGDVINETSTLDGEIDSVHASVNWRLSDNLENLTLLGTATNGAGNDRNNVLTGNASNNVLNGGTGQDTLIGGTGNDNYVVDNLGDTVVELADEGIDLIRTSVSYTLSANVEDGQLLYTTASLTLTGNDLDNRLTGNSAGNVLNGMAGADTLDGGAGNDSYYVDNVGDVLIEQDASLTQIDSVMSSISYTLGANFENLKLLGSGNLDATGNALNNRITGNTGDNILDGGSGSDTLSGGAGNDTYLIDDLGDVINETSTLDGEIDSVRASVNWRLSDNLENLTLLGTATNGAGNDRNNVLTGNASNNVLNGGIGQDTLIGGTGNDNYVVDNLGDTVVELGNEGIDLIRTSVSYTLSANVEDGQLLYNDSLTLTGNDLDNRLTGNSAGNVLNGMAGADTLDGGAGNDSYYVDNVGDVLIEQDASLTQIDSVMSSISYTLGANFENLKLLGSGNLDATGNALNNRITGNVDANTLNGGGGNDILNGAAGDDRLIGGIGVDTLTGGDGADVFVFGALDELGNNGVHDIITDFNRLQGDRIDLTGVDTFSFIDSNAFTGAGQLRFVDSVLYGDINGDLSADFEIQLVGVNTFNASDLVA